MSTICNHVQLIGRLGKDPEIKNFEGGKKLAKASLATSDFYRDTKGDLVTETQWHQIVAWGKQADVMERYLKKGSELVLHGKVMTHSYDDKDGQKKYMTEIHISSMHIPNQKSQGSAANN